MIDANSELNIPIRSLTIIIVKFVFLLTGALLALLWIFSYFNSLYLMAIVFGTLALVISVTLLAIQRRLFIYSLLTLVIGILLTASGLIVGHGAMLPIPGQAAIVQAGVGLVLLSEGLVLMAFGLTVISLVLGMSYMNKSDLMKYKYPKSMMITFFVCGIVLFASGLYLSASWLQHLRG